MAEQAVAAASADPDLEEVAWSFDPDTDGAWGWAFGDQQAADIWRKRTGLDALTARRVALSFVAYGIESAEQQCRWCEEGFSPVEADQWIKAVGGAPMNAFDAAKWRDHGVTAECLRRYRETGKIPSDDMMATPKFPPSSSVLKCFAEQVIDWQPPRTTLAFLTKVCSNPRLGLKARQDETEWALSSIWASRARDRYNVYLLGHDQNEQRMFLAGLSRPRWLWGPKLRRWWRNRTSAAAGTG